MGNDTEGMAAGNPGRYGNLIDSTIDLMDDFGWRKLAVGNSQFANLEFPINRWVTCYRSPLQGQFQIFAEYGADSGLKI